MGLPVGFSPGQVHYGFNVTKEMTVKHSWEERVIPKFKTIVEKSKQKHSNTNIPPPKKQYQGNLSQ